MRIEWTNDGLDWHTEVFDDQGYSRFPGRLREPEVRAILAHRRGI
jgi:hypothetical protein